MDNKCKNIDDYEKVPYIIGKLFGKYLNSFKHKNAKEIYKVEPKKADFKWSTEKNHTDSGVFLMCHMDTYMGENIKEYHCGIFAKCSGQVNQLKVLRRKYATRILLSELNLKKEEILVEANHFHCLRKEEKNNILDYAIKNWNNRG
ncbi:uncharacterized protein LOC110913694 [Helianthus annuus]|uniref:uncharacterized protein LOC110913694 n=1 Tax=Helianthus annuus TaxID=4232 RepID=UPI0016530D7E|nr:uncharacterized protein LOC110913694 [Helianthus annuus]